ncbi:prepilin-type N-terminal cleavage/methylation domain-containing protein [Lysinibacillus sphaericus]|uniref:ComG operon protein 4 n=1 Tax=Lysinibacillus sphaericus OT4b.31 TaxID=1285586 RepID=R7ZCG3_LYSSH|nr:prepilin-type N-terminal cleavage/methylation domain-containing protein [Lysinibacillus sphaericus]EON71681.1 ComG operon protein 4 [Lysinibacillus sphaericus OT4b.31]
MNDIKNECGFTLVEMLLVLFIVMCLTGIVTKLSLKAAETKELERFFTQIQLDIQFIQTYSMQQREYVSMKFESPPHRYLIKKIFIPITTSDLSQTVWN